MIFDELLAEFPFDAQEAIVSALDDLHATADMVEQVVDSTAIPALDAVMAASRAGIPEVDVQAANDRIRSALDRLADKSREAHALVGGEG